MEKMDRKKIEEIAKKHELKLLLIFGSQASGKTHKFSDHDFGFVGRGAVDYKKRGDLENDLAKLVNSKFVEAVDLEKAGPFLLKEVVKNNKVLFENEFEYENFFSYAVRTYLDADRLFKLQNQLYSQAVNKYKRKMYAQ